MKGKFDAYVLWSLTKSVQNWIVDRSTARDFMVIKDKSLYLLRFLWLYNDVSWQIIKLTFSKTHKYFPSNLINIIKQSPFSLHTRNYRPPSEEIIFTARPKINSHSQIFRYGRRIFCLPHRPKFSDIFDLCLHWVSVVHVFIWPQRQ